MAAKRSLKSVPYRFLRQLHLYGGLFLCPFLLMYAISTIRLNHGWNTPPTDSIETVALPIPDDILARVTDRQVIDGLSPEQQAAARQALVDTIIAELDLSGEIAGNGAVRNGKTMLNVQRPGMIKRVEVNVNAQEATITKRRQGLFGTMRYLHLNPGPHRHPQWIGTKAWGWIADTTVYVTVFLTVSGVYLWWFIRAERKGGLVLLAAGAVSFAAILYALMFA